MQVTFTVATTKHQELVDMTYKVMEVVRASKVKDGFCIVYIPHATAGVILNESADPNIKTDFLNAINRAIPEHAGYLHDHIDDNAAAHIKSAIVGSSVTVPVKDGKLELGTWQAIMLCEFDGPRSSRRVIVQVCGSNLQ
ncbi:MAG: secondary thiamine-phosphate synthase enzyme YjbQ [bacterium]|nr:secondary thiamine-phosphate synthase enzyme YjbQ [bacterium]